MTPSEIADQLELTAKLLELHGENLFKVQSLKNAAYRIYKSNLDLTGKSLLELEDIEGIGKRIAGKIIEMQQSGITQELRLLLDKTPPGLLDILRVKGLGPKKVAQLWRELAIESLGELQYACNENRLIDLKGFGAKTQQSILENIAFLQLSQGKFHYARIIDLALSAVNDLKKEFNTEFVSLTGELYRKCEVVDKIQFLIGSENQRTFDVSSLNLPLQVDLLFCAPTEFYLKLVMTSSTSEHRAAFNFDRLNEQEFTSEKAVYEALQISFVEPELREGIIEVTHAREGTIPELLSVSDLKGALHNHSTYSDGQNTLEEMALRCKQMGYSYFGIADHSQSAFYAGGLKPERIIEQHREIDALNEKLFPFRIFKGIESDILNDGSLDYDDEVLKTFDYVVASIHSGLKMEEEKAMQRLIKAIENPFTTILGHPTGRLLLSRPGYPVNHRKIIDACAANGVVIELNAHPYRLDIDWRWIPYCMERGVLISVNPDAHHVDGISDMYYGVCAARKGMLTKDFCFNAMDLNTIEKHFQSRKK